MPYIIRAANHKTVREIHQEIRAAQVQDVAKAAVGFKLVQYLPTFLFDLSSGTSLEEKGSTAVEEVRGDGGHLGSRHVWQRCRLGHSSSYSSITLDYGGRHWREARGRGRADSDPGLSESDDQF